MNDTFSFLIAPAISLCVGIVAMINKSQWVRVVCIVLSVLFAGFFFGAIGQVTGVVENNVQFGVNFVRPQKQLIEHLDHLAQTREFDQLTTDLAVAKTNRIPRNVKDTSFGLFVYNLVKSDSKKESSTEQGPSPYAKPGAAE